jgi:glycolate oxidase
MLNTAWPARAGSASLMIIVDGRDSDDTLAQAQAIGETAEKEGALEVLLTEQKARQEEILSLRSMLYESIRPRTAEGFDVCVPRSHIAGHVAFARALEERIGIPIVSYGHAADGNVHSHTLKARLDDGLFGEEIPGWWEKNAAARKALYEDVGARGGVISGEHGIGLSKRAYLEANIGSAQVAMMRAIKKALDPAGILNPGKIFEP